jgi:hypothetical protein
MGNPSPVLADGSSVVEHDDEPKVADIETPAEDPRDDEHDPSEDEEEDDSSGSESEEDKGKYKVKWVKGPTDLKKISIRLLYKLFRR